MYGFNIFWFPVPTDPAASSERLWQWEDRLLQLIGMLSEIVDNTTTGFVIEDTTENLATAILKLTRDECLRKSLAEASLKRA